MDTFVERPSPHQAIINRFVAACEADPRILAATLHGSHARGDADAYSDLDLGLIVAEEAYAAFCGERESFIRQLGEPVFLESFDLEEVLLFVFADGTEGELIVGRPSSMTQMYLGPHRILLDKQGLLQGAVFTGRQASPTEQLEQLRRLLVWFWHDLSHFIAAMGRGQLWWAQGQLEILRGMCVNLLRLRHDFFAGSDTYDKVELALSAEQLAPLEATLCRFERAAMLDAVRLLVSLYQELARPLAQDHGIPYPHELERIVCARLAWLA